MNRSILCLALLAASTALAAKTPLDETHALNADARLSLENVKGLISVTTWDRNEVRVEGYLGEGTEGLEVKGSASNLSIAVKYPESGGSWFGGWGKNSSGDSELRVTVPTGISLDVEAVAADVDVKGVRGAELSIDNVSGDVDVESSARDVEVNTVSGSQVLVLHSNDVSAESVSGDVQIRGELGGRIDLEAVSGSLTLDSSTAAKSVTAGVVSGDVTLRTGLQSGGRLRAESLSGDLEVVLPKSTSAALSASSFTGSITSFAGDVETEEHGPGSNLETKLGSGDGSIDLETFSGDLTVRSE